MTNNFTAVFQKTDNWWIGFVEELPGANTQGETLDEARENLKEAVTLILQANRDLAEKKLRKKILLKKSLQSQVIETAAIIKTSEIKQLPFIEKRW